MISPQSIKSFCAFAFHTIKTYLESSKQLPYPSSFPQISSPLFVTWHISIPEYEEPVLRGCIGTFASGPLSTQLPQYSMISAFQDTRFPPISLGEIEKLQCTVSILCEFEDIKDPYDWKIGTHGIKVIFTDERQYSATYLPEIAEDQHWTQEQTIEHLIQKSGYHKAFNTIKDFKMFRYQSKKEMMTYKEYIEFIAVSKLN